MWKPGRSNRFKKGYKKIGAELLKRVNKALKTLLESEHPENIGQIKTGAKKGYFSYEIGRSCRILYLPHHDTKVLEFARICSHKEVYGP